MPSSSVWHAYLIRQDKRLRFVPWQNPGIFPVPEGVLSETDAYPLYTRHSGSGAGPASPASGKCAAVIIRRDVRPESSQDRCIGFRRFSVDGNGFCTYIGEILYVIGGLKVWKQQKSVNKQFKMIS